MANWCEFSMKVYGKRKDIDKLQTYLNQEYKGRVTDRIHFYGVYDSNVVYTPIDAKPNEYVQADITGYTRWSGYGTLVHSHNDTNKAFEKEFGSTACHKQYHLMTMEEMCRRYKMCCEIYTLEPGCAFSEHYVIDQTGNIPEESECEYYSFVVSNNENDDPNYHSFKEFLDKNPKIDPDTIWVDGEKYSGNVEDYSDATNMTVCVNYFDVSDFSEFYAMTTVKPKKEIK